MTTLREVIEHLALRIVDHEYTGNRFKDSGIVAQLIDRAISEHLSQYSIRSATLKGNHEQIHNETTA
jgi:hypothetical protein